MASKIIYDGSVCGCCGEYDPGKPVVLHRYKEGKALTGFYGGFTDFSTYYQSFNIAYNYQWTLDATTVTSVEDGDKQQNYDADYSFSIVEDTGQPVNVDLTVNNWYNLDHEQYTLNVAASVWGNYTGECQRRARSYYEYEATKIESVGSAYEDPEGSNLWFCESETTETLVQTGGGSEFQNQPGETCQISDTVPLAVNDVNVTSEIGSVSIDGIVNARSNNTGNTTAHSEDSYDSEDGSIHWEWQKDWVLGNPVTVSDVVAAAPSFMVEDWSDGGNGRVFIDTAIVESTEFADGYIRSGSIHAVYRVVETCVQIPVGHGGNKCEVEYEIIQIDKDDENSESQHSTGSIVWLGPGMDGMPEDESWKTAWISLPEPTEQYSYYLKLNRYRYYAAQQWMDF